MDLKKERYKHTKADLSLWAQIHRLRPKYVALTNPWNIHKLALPSWAHRLQQAKNGFTKSQEHS